ncbi:hypothetical protein MUS1_14620 [Marinomonas ushuaiensis DSM 15871]|uniref:DUF3080 domain-containing protein n=2 Tax=Marinomonas TaxID=28253 RepID=X7E5M3_9GAMM|nr:hypothetical protein MUS1_14620 [Marinomonas ushuaiensis DSM 15871]
MILLSGIILVGVGGCDTRFKAEAVLSQYVMDLNRSQFFVIDSPAIIMPISLPALRDRQQKLSNFDIGLLEFLSLQQCDVGIVAGKKNSILGKVMPDSQRFLYELDIIRAIESCDIDDDALASELQLVAEKKRIELPIAFGNAIFNGEESKEFFSISNGFFPLNDTTENQQELISALNRLVDIGERLADLPNINGQVFENDLRVLMNSEYAGKLLYSLAQLTNYLSLVSGQVGTLNKEVCGAPMTYLKQQFDVHYVEKIQPYMGRLNSSAYQVLPLLNRLGELSSSFSVDMRRFLKQFSLRDEHSEWLRYQRASQMHAKQWSALFKSCSVSLR